MIFSARAKRCAGYMRGASLRATPLVGLTLRATLLVAMALLAGCGLSDGPGALFVDPGHYSAYHCKDLIAESQNLANRERDLRNLMDKASEGGGGSVIGAFAYRSDYETVLEQQKLLKREVAAQKCELTPNYNSDHVIR